MTGLLPRSALAGLGWGPALRIALRELRRAPGRTLLVVVMVLLPVTAVVALDTLLRTGDVDVVEGLPRDLGDAQARIEVEFSGGPVVQTPDGTAYGTGSGAPRAIPEAELRAALPSGTRLLAVTQPYEQRGVRTGSGRTVRVDPVGVDLADPRARGPFVLLRGEAPDSADEVAVTPQVERAGFPAGSTMVLPDGDEVTVTGTVLYPRTYGAPRAVYGLPEALGLQDRAVSRYYAFGPAVSWDDVLELNALGATVLSRSVVLDPPPDDQVPEPPYDTFDEHAVALLGLVVVIAVLEVVLLAGPAFAVGARRQRRALALLSAGGGEPRHVRRVVLAQGLLVGVGCALLGGPLGVAVAAALRAPLSRWAGADWGPFDVSLRDVVLLCLLGGLTALLAAVVPAVLAAREPVVASLRGLRRAPSAPWRTALPGAVLLALGVLACRASLERGSPELLVAFSALPTVLGAVLLAPLLLRLLGRLAGRLPLPLRFAVRDADRQRGRTAPAVAAVAATVAGVVALGTAVSSDAAERRATYVGSSAVGTAVVSVNATDLRGPGAVDLAALAEVARGALPGEPVTVLRGLALDPGGVPSAPYEVVHVCRPGAPPAAGCEGTTISASVGLSQLLVGPEALDALAPLLEPVSLRAARRAVAAGQVAVPGPLPAEVVELRRQRQAFEADGVERAVLLQRVRSAAVPLVGRARDYPVAQGVLSEQVAARLGDVVPVALVAGDALTAEQEDALVGALAAVDERAGVTVERGPGDDAGLAVLLLSLGAAVLVLGGSLAATSLALTESRPDLATLGAVGARPRTRRSVAGAYAFVLALAGALLGVAAGAVPGVAGAVAITRGSYTTLQGGALVRYDGLGGYEAALRFLDVPWLLLLGLLVGLPLLAGVVAAASVRSRLPGLGRRLAA